MRVDPHKYGESVLLAVSGGIDSMVLASLMLHFRESSGGTAPVSLAVAHCNFHLRADESDGDEALVREWAGQNGLTCHVADFDTEEYAHRNGVSIEMAARTLRYEFFDRLCRENSYAGVCVAHNADDNAETLLLNLVRGTGLEGACAMGEVVKNPCGDTWVFRPLLGYSREEIRQYALKWGVRWREDSTNAETDARRNVIRNLVFPLLKELNPSLIRTLNSDIEHFRQARDIVSAAVSQSGPLLREDAYAGRNTRRKYLEINSLRNELFWQYRLFECLSSMGFNSSVINDISTMVRTGSTKSGKVFDSLQWRAVTSQGKLIFEQKNDASTTGTNTVIELLEWQAGADPRTERGVILIDADAIGGEPRLRKWRDGDYLIPIGMKGKKKVSDMLTDLKYDISSKSKVLVVEGCGNHVLAVVGERIDASVAVSPTTTRVYRISME